MENQPKRNYKDNLFVSIFGRNCNAKEYFLDLYNALHETNLKIGEVKIEPFMLENVVYTGEYNDVSMILDGKIIVLAEQQSTINYNMPLRCLKYFTELMDRKYVVQDKDKYKRKQIQLANPEFYVFYNGEEDYPDYEVLKLSDAFQKTDYSTEISLDLSVKVYNINLGKNKKILEKCKALNAYSKFVMFAREALKNGTKDYISYALEKCKNQNLLPEYFENISREESMFLIGDYDREMDIKVRCEEAFEDGESKANLTNAITAVKDFNLPVEQVAQKFNVPLEDLKKALKVN